MLSQSTPIKPHVSFNSPIRQKTIIECTFPMQQQICTMYVDDVMTIYCPCVFTAFSNRTVFNVFHVAVLTGHVHGGCRRIPVHKHRAGAHKYYMNQENSICLMIRTEQRLLSVVTGWKIATRSTP